ncbi:GxxExxY protein [Neolewinella antarctica]|uniref:GxxExxY protein n=1 Tax=Neolewinella antarctica TaxID=442734 RepID=A0ABX0XFM5_9BACT|nr:GxxExxY protein [Neolewinella antarctica]NJC27673.1 GxxExxY protein [Neolewinella antarctica]
MNTESAFQPTITQFTKASIDDLTYQVVGLAIEVQRHMGAGLKESVYEECLAIELGKAEIPFRRQVSFYPIYKGTKLSMKSVIDLLVDDILVVELKAVKEVLPVHKAQALNYINLLRMPKALILNFNSANIANDGRLTLVNDLYASLP